MWNKILLGFIIFSPLSLSAETLPDFIIPLRDAVYEQTITSTEAERLAEETEKAAMKTLSGYKLDAILSRCEYYLARILQYEKQNNAAIEHYQRGLELAENSIKQTPTTEGWEMRAANTSQLCTLKSVGWAMFHGLDVERFAKNALKLNGKNAGAQYMISARWIYAPAPFHDVDRGLKEMKELLNGDYDRGKDHLFDVYSALGYGYVRSKKNDEVNYWIGKALDIYPTNKYTQDLLTGKEMPVETKK